MDRKGFVEQLWLLYQDAAACHDWVDALMLLKEIFNHKPKEKNDG